MTNTRLIAFDALFLVVYVGLAAALVGVLAALAGLYAVGVEMSPGLIAVAAADALGFLLLPVMPRLYRRIAGHPFRWRTNAVLSG